VGPSAGVELACVVRWTCRVDDFERVERVVSELDRFVCDGAGVRELGVSDGAGVVDLQERIERGVRGEVGSDLSSEVRGRRSRWGNRVGMVGSREVSLTMLRPVPHDAGGAT